MEVEAQALHSVFWDEENQKAERTDWPFLHLFLSDNLIPAQIGEANTARVKWTHPCKFHPI